ncbi:MAG: DUF1028 domain-containing protein, partial [Proteobacteria bacterium]|nr:DUF1028 domain-containing protein [Burkholderiales bacterium]
MGFSILARCARTGQIGLAMASDTVAVGRTCDGALRPGAGGSITQGDPNPRNNRFATSLLAQGARPAHVLRELIASDPQSALRQIAVIDRAGEIAVHEGGELQAVVAHQVGDGYAVLGAALASEGVVAAMAGRFTSDP